MAKLGEVCEKKIETLKSNSVEYIDYIDIASVNNKTKMIEAVQTITTKDAPSRAKQIVKKGDVLVSTVRPNLNAVAIIDKDYENVLVASTGYSVIRCDDFVNNRYIFYFCQSETFINKMIAQATGASYPAVSNSIVKNCEVPLPSIEEQNRIARLFDGVTNLIEKRERQLIQLDELVKSRFIEMFGDPVCNPMNWQQEEVNALCSQIYGGGTPSKAHPEYYADGNFPWVSSKDMKMDVIYDSQIKINELGIRNSTAKLVPVNSVIMVIRSGILKHTLPVAINAVPITVNQDLKVFRPGDKLIAVYLMYLFKMMEKDILSGVRAVTADNIEFDTLKNRKIIVPPLDLQNQFADFVAQVDKSKLVAQRGAVGRFFHKRDSLHRIYLQ